MAKDATPPSKPSPKKAGVSRICAVTGDPLGEKEVDLGCYPPKLKLGEGVEVALVVSKGNRRAIVSGAGAKQALEALLATL